MVGEEWMMAELSRSRDGRQARTDGGAQRLQRWRRAGKQRIE